LLSGTAWNLVGQALPLLAAVAAIPFLVRLLGLERCGFLALAWVLIGYASLLDLGLSRALVRIVAERLALGDEDGAAARGRVGLSLLLLLGLVVGGALQMEAWCWLQQPRVVPLRVSVAGVCAAPWPAAACPCPALFTRRATGCSAGPFSRYR
jgi:O-antigen/teichoic acid export membrane protein